MSRKYLNNVTLVAVACTKVEETIKAMKKSMRGIRYAEAILITHQSVLLDNDNIKVVNIEKLDYKGYNHFIIYRLKDYIKTDYALIVQYDGYVLRPDQWQEEFLQYDYIGAPWLPGKYFTLEGREVRVGNGGFSLRSKKLLEAPSVLNLPFSDNGSGYFNEDGILCIHQRKALEDYGIKYAPVNVAARFSTEKRCKESYRKTFGFHNKKTGPRFDAIRMLLFKIKVKYREKKKIWRRIISSCINDVTTWKTIASQTRTGKIYDVFTFLNELDLLEIRLSILDSYVDYFVIIEATDTFSGKPKPLIFKENERRFSKWKHKIIYHIIDDTPSDEAAFRAALENPATSEINKQIISQGLVSPNVGRNKDGSITISWLREFFQKESARKALTNLDDDDICFISDVDEIWNPKARVNLWSNRIFKLRQLMYAYYLNNRSNEMWIGPIVTKYKNIKNEILNHLRTERRMSYTYVRNGGWHFTNMGGAEQVKQKIDSYGHQEYNTPEIKAAIEKRIAENKDFVGRKFKFWVDDSDLPPYILENRDRYKRHFK